MNGDDRDGETVLFDVLAVLIDDPRTVRLLAHDKRERDADAVIDMAVIRNGVEIEFFTMAPAGKYRDGDEWRG